MRGSTAGLAETIVLPSNNAHAILLEIIDILLSSFIIGPLVVGYWRGTWNSMNHFLFPNNQFYSSCASLAIGFFGHMIFNFFQTKLANKLNPNERRLTFYIVSRLYTTIYGVICVNGWRGLWILIDIYSAYEIYPILVTTLFCAIILALMRAIRNVSAAPFFLATDNYKEYFNVPDRKSVV